MSALLVAGVRCGVAVRDHGIVNGRIRSCGDLPDSTAVVRLDTGQVVVCHWSALRAER